MSAKPVEEPFISKRFVFFSASMLGMVGAAIAAFAWIAG
jgi:hypothetical protein